MSELFVMGEGQFVELATPRRVARQTGELGEHGITFHLLHSCCHVSKLLHSCCHVSKLLHSCRHVSKLLHSCRHVSKLLHSCCRVSKVDRHSVYTSM